MFKKWTKAPTNDAYPHFHSNLTHGLLVWNQAIKTLEITFVLLNHI